ncbi:unnamed protein product [Hermetia illucens]|uniref:Major facilitator superfamily (MFS) profile domain-containing protein n=1 Tax=Hermetia illucens TaxID=343691 RepID=A0A7R8UBN3_HERIL|nr:facilitated trehalose transporter Tret1-2 homolog [Hermetia illucens]CAD7076969.1 unnamed protein product [Hermetia illucens]
MTGQESASLVTANGTKIVTGPHAANSPLVESQPNKKDRGKPLRQIIAAFVANLGTINTGLIFGFSAVVIPQLEAEDSVIPITESQASWIASLASAGTPFGCIVSGYLMDAVGRKLTLLITQIPAILGWILICSADRVELIYAGRFFVGFGSGMVGAPARVYTSEVTQPHLRGMLSALASVFISFGVLMQYTLGSFLTWKILSIVSTMIPVASLILMFFMPETPNYLVAHAKSDAAQKSLTKLRGSSCNVEGEMQQLEEFNRKTNANNKVTAKEKLALLLSPTTLKPFGILVLYFMMYQFSGVNTITFYAVEIFRDSGTTMNTYTCTILLGVVRLIFTIVACISLRRCGRRPLTFISGVGCGVSMLGLGIYLYFKYKWDTSDPPITPTATWFPVACIFIFTIACTLGFLVVPWVMIGEIYPQKVRGIVGGLTTCSAHIFIFVVVKTYPFLAHALYRHGAFMLYGCISLVGMIFFYLCLPETKGRTLQEIEDYFSGRIKSLKKEKPKKGADPIPPIVEKNKLLN